jgi:hypothetical protein
MSLYPTKQQFGKSSMSHFTPNLQIQSKRIKTLQMENKFCALNIATKTLPYDSAVAPSCKYVQNQHTGHMCVESFSSHNHEGAEGWARLGREFDLQLQAGADS